MSRDRRAPSTTASSTRRKRSGVFGVPTMVFNGELFWGGDRIDMLIERIQNPEGIAAALGSRHGSKFRIS